MTAGLLQVNFAHRSGFDPGGFLFLKWGIKCMNVPEQQCESWFYQDGESDTIIPICAIMEPYTTTSPDTSVEMVRAMFEKDEPISAIIVTRNQRVQGLVMNLHLDRVLSLPFGVPLYYNKPVERIMDPHPLQVGMGMPLEEVARLAMGRENTKVFDHIIVSEQGEIKGVATVSRLLDTLAEQQKKRAVFFAETNRKLSGEIHERKRAESDRHNALAALKSSEEKYRSMFDNTETGMVLFDRDFTITLVNGKINDLMGRPDGQPSGLKKICHYVPPVHMKKIYNAFEKIQRSPCAVSPLSFEMEVRDTRGQVKTILVRISIIAGTREGIASITDLTDQKREAQEKNRLATAMEQSSEGIIITSPEGLIDYVNPAFEKITGYPSFEVLGRKPDFLWLRVPETPEVAQHPFIASQNTVWRGRITCQRKNGGFVRTETAISPISDRNGGVISSLFILRDVSVEDQLQNKLQQAQKIQAIGTLAGGIAHDFNNILAGIMGYTEMSLFEADKGSNLERRMNRVLSACFRAKQLVDQILTFSRQNPQEQMPILMSPIVKEALKLIRATIPANIEIKQNILVKNDVILADPSQIHQIVMNLCANASHAMKNTGGTLSVHMDRLELDQDSARNFIDLPPGSYICTMVTDTGCGMPRNVLDRVFEPFFTTKKQNEGTGMGLSVVHGIVKRLGGAIHVYSEPGKGTEFKILIPRHDMKLNKEPERVWDLKQGNEHVLLVDDEDFIIDAGQEILESLGYRVTALNNSVEALKLFKQAPEAFDLLITDQTMPHMTGDELAQRVLACRSDIPVILCTGFSSTMDESEAAELGIQAFLMKPIIKNTFARVVRSVLDGGGVRKIPAVNAIDLGDI